MADVATDSGIEGEHFAQGWRRFEDFRAVLFGMPGFPVASEDRDAWLDRLSELADDPATGDAIRALRDSVGVSGKAMVTFYEGAEEFAAAGGLRPDAFVTGAFAGMVVALTAAQLAE